MPWSRLRCRRSCSSSAQGAIGIEFASFYSDMGAKVTVVEMLDRILPVEDAEVSAHMAKTLTKQGMTLVTGAKVSDVTPGPDGVAATITGADGQARTDTYSHVIVAIGIISNLENIGLEALGVVVERGRIKVDPWGATNVAGLWAIGDVTGAAVAGAQGEPRGHRRGREDRRTRPAPLRDMEHPGVHLFAAAGGERRPDRGAGPRGGTRGQGSASSRSSATARRSRSARPTASSRRCSTPRPASCSART